MSDMLNKSQNLNTSGEHVKPLDIDAMVDDAEVMQTHPESDRAKWMFRMTSHVLALAAECKRLQGELEFSLAEADMRTADALLETDRATLRGDALKSESDTMKQLLDYARGEVAALKAQVAELKCSHAVLAPSIDPEADKLVDGLLRKARKR